uniref:Uncharacterized protein n=1 Tax=Trichogramma kaykai TaxID=54128 RepID=A0ABD2W4B0_9HYME
MQPTTIEPSQEVSEKNHLIEPVESMEPIEATSNATQAETLAGILQEMEAEMEADIALQGVEPDPTTTGEKLSKLETELLRMAEDSEYVPPYNAREQFYLENAVVRESMKPGALSLFLKLAELYEGAAMCRRNAMHQKLQPAAVTDPSEQIEPVSSTNVIQDCSISQRDEAPTSETDTTAHQLCAAAAEARKNAVEIPMEEDTAITEPLQQSTEMQTPDNAQPLRQPLVPNNTTEQEQLPELSKPVQLVQAMPLANEDTDDSNWASADSTEEARAMDWEEEPRSADDSTLTLRPLQGESFHAVEEKRMVGSRRNNPRRNLELSDHVSAHLPSRSPSPELFGPSQLVRRKASNSRRSNGYQDTQPSRIRHTDGSVVRLRGVKFGGLRQIRTDYSVDPPDFACFNCWIEGHNAITLKKFVLIMYDIYAYNVDCINIDKGLKSSLDEEHANHILKNIKKLNSRKPFVQEALALLVDANLTKASYNVIRKAALKTSHDMYPTYDEVQYVIFLMLQITKAKLDTYPNNIVITESKCEVPLADLLSHTITRLIKYLYISYPEELNMKLRLIYKLKSILGVAVDKPTPGSGNTNDGNTARKFFEAVTKVSEVTGFNIDLLNSFKVILAVISCPKRTNIDAFKEYCHATAEKFVKHYNWYCMPASLHILLMHGYKIIESLPLPITVLSEEAQEANHKNVKRFRDKFTRKDTRIYTNTDLFNRLLMSSDPLVSIRRSLIKRKKHVYSQKIKNLIIETNVDDIFEYESENDVDNSGKED